MCQNGCPNGRGNKSKKLSFFSLVHLWVPLGSFSLTFVLPGHHFGTFLDALNIILAPLGPIKMMPGLEIYWRCSLSWHLLDLWGAWEIHNLMDSQLHDLFSRSTVATHKRLLRTFLSLAHLNLIRYCWELTFMRWTTREPNNQRKRILKPTSLQRGGGVGPTAKWIIKTQKQATQTMYVTASCPYLL